jgi:hypothetical protein
MPESASCYSVLRQPLRPKPGSSCWMPKHCTAILTTVIRYGPVIADLERLTGVAVRGIHGDKGYRGHNYPDRFKVWISGQLRRVAKAIRREMRRRAAVEPVIGCVAIISKAEMATASTPCSPSPASHLTPVKVAQPSNSLNGFCLATNDEAGDPFIDNLWNGTRPERNNGCAARHCFDHDQTEAFRPVDRKQQGRRPCWT